MKLKQILFSALFICISSLLITSCGSVSKPKCLAVGSARSVMIKENQETPGTYLVTVKGSNPSTLIFTQQPKRQSKIIDTEAFLENWDKSYQKTSPNVTFTSVNPNRTISNVLVLSNPKYDNKTQTITFRAEAVAPTELSVQTGVFTNVTITYDSQVQKLLFAPAKD